MSAIYFEPVIMQAGGTNLDTRYEKRGKGIFGCKTFKLLRKSLGLVFLFGRLVFSRALFSVCFFFYFECTNDLLK